MGHLLAMIAQAQQDPTVSAINNSECGIVYNKPSLVQMFEDFYTLLYRCKGTAISNLSAQFFLATLKFPKLKPTDRLILDAPLSLQELELSVSQMHKKRECLDCSVIQVGQGASSVLLYLQIFKLLRSNIQEHLSLRAPSGLCSPIMYNTLQYFT